MKNNKENTHTLEKYILTKIPVVKKTATVKSVFFILEKESNTYDSVDYIYVIDNNKDLIGVFSIKELFNKPENTPIKKFLQKNLVMVSPETEIEKIAHLALKHDLKAIPVVKSKKLIGIISSKRILSTINRALREDIFHFAGIHKSHLDFENSLEIPLFKVLKDRLSWLIIGLFGAMLMALYIGLFEETLAQYLIIASFIPVIVYVSGALGTQLQTVFVRDLAILGKEINLKKYLLRQIMISSLIAITISILTFFGISLFWKLPYIGFVISLAVFLSLIITSLTAFLITLAIKKFRFDPAIGSGPIATIISDISSVIIYFIVVISLL